MNNVTSEEKYQQQHSPRVTEILYTIAKPEDILDECIHTLMGGEQGTSKKDWSVAVELFQVCPKIARVTGEWGRYALHYACSNQAPLFVVLALLEVYPKAAHKKATWRAGGWLPIHCAAACNAPVDVVQALLEQNIACAKATDNDGRLPLHLACYHQADTELVSALILAHDHGPREDDIEGKLPVHLALECLIPMWPTVRTMLTANSEKSCKIKHADGTRALHWACRHRAPIDVICTMLEAYPRAVRKPDARGRTALHWSCVYGDHAAPPNVETINQLVHVYPRAARQVDDHGMYPLFLALEYEYKLSEQVHHALVQAYPYALDIWRGNAGMHELIQAMGGEHHDAPTDWVRAHQLFQDFPETLERKGTWGKTCLHYASAANAPLMIIQYLINAQPRAIKTLDRHGSLPLHGAARNPNTKLDILQALIAAYPPAIRVRTTLDGYLPIHFAAMHRVPFVNVVAILDQYPEAARLTALRQPRGTLPLQLALAKYHLSSEQNHDGRQITTVAIPESMNQTHESALDHVADVNTIVKPHGEPPMWDVIDLLLRAYPPAAKERENEDGMLPLHIAARMHAPFELLEDLLATYPLGTQVEDNRGKLPLHWALQTKASMKNINALFEAYPMAAKSISLDLDYKIIRWQSEQEGMPAVERKKQELALYCERKGKVDAADIQGNTQLTAGHDGAHHRDEWKGSDNFGLSRSYLSEWSNHRIEGHRKKKIFKVAANKNTFTTRRIEMIHASSNRCKLCSKKQMDEGKPVTGRKYRIKELIKHFDQVHNVEARIK
jgi:ankyrin repeat protein